MILREPQAMTICDAVGEAGVGTHRKHLRQTLAGVERSRRFGDLRPVDSKQPVHPGQPLSDDGLKRIRHRSLKLLQSDAQTLVCIALAANRSRLTHATCKRWASTTWDGALELTAAETASLTRVSTSSSCSILVSSMILFSRSDLISLLTFSSASSTQCSWTAARTMPLTLSRISDESPLLDSFFSCLQAISIFCNKRKDS